MCELSNANDTPDSAACFLWNCIVRPLTIYGDILKQIICTAEVLTARQRSWGKIMFSQVSFSHSVHGGGVGISGPMSFLGSGYLWYQVPWGAVCPGGLVIHVPSVRLPVS